MINWIIDKIGTHFFSDIMDTWYDEDDDYWGE